jgi:hypothetical protein
MGASFNSVDVPVKFHSPKCLAKFRNSENLSNQTTKFAGITTVRMTLSVFMAMKVTAQNTKVYVPHKTRIFSRCVRNAGCVNAGLRHFRSVWHNRCVLANLGINFVVQKQ